MTYVDVVKGGIMVINSEVYISKSIKKYIGADLISCKLLGKGANGSVYRADISAEPYVLAIKVTNYSEMLANEVFALNYINGRVDILLPKVFFSHIANDDIPINVLGMTYLDGIGGNKINWLFAGKKKREAFKRQVIDNLIKLRDVTNEKFGYVDNACFESWIDFYRPFAKARLDYMSSLQNKGNVALCVEETLTRAYGILDRALNDCGKPTLTHGDYWLPNFVVDKKTKEFVGCVDPFNIMYADAEYELFALMQFGYLRLYELYKKSVPTSKYCDLKSRMYALFSEVYWCEILGNSIDALKYMKGMAKVLKIELDKAGM